MSKKNPIKAEIEAFTDYQPKGGDRLQRLLDGFVQREEVRLFVPWAIASNGRTELNTRDTRTLDWLFGDSGLGSRLSRFGEVSWRVMFADAYALRNGADISVANAYWTCVSETLGGVAKVEFVNSSDLERDPKMKQLQAENAYALEKLRPSTRDKVVNAAGKYGSGEDGTDGYSEAARYAMFRSAEADYVECVLGELWVSMNWPDRDAMCADAPRMYVPEDVRAPWLYGEVVDAAS